MEHGAIGMLGEAEGTERLEDTGPDHQKYVPLWAQVLCMIIRYSLRTILRAIDSHIRVAPCGCRDTRELSDGAALVWLFWSGRDWKRKQHTHVCRHTCTHSPQGGSEEGAESEMAAVSQSPDHRGGLWAQGVGTLMTVSCALGSACPR